MNNMPGPAVLSLDDRLFRSLQNSATGEVSPSTVFHYHQDGNLVWAEYAGGAIRAGRLLAVVQADGSLDMRYHHVNQDGVLMTGVCLSVPEVLPDGRIRLHECWQWTSGDCSSGQSVVEELHRP